jgi:hypothetical protein
MFGIAFSVLAERAKYGLDKSTQKLRQLDRVKFHA